MPKPTPAKLYHYTCEHAASAISREMVLRSNSDLTATTPEAVAQGEAWIADVVWLTDLDWVTGGKGGTAHLLGLNPVHLRCQRTEYRATVVPADDVVWWPTYRRDLTGDARLMSRRLNAAEGVLPAHWWVSRTPLAVVELVATTPNLIKRQRAETLIRRAGQ